MAVWSNIWFAMQTVGQKIMHNDFQILLDKSSGKFPFKEANPFILAILAAPMDCAPRLIYMDWLIERGFDKAAERQRRLVDLMGRAEVWRNIGSKIVFYVKHKNGNYDVYTLRKDGMFKQSRSQIKKYCLDWIIALESGEYKQGVSLLKSLDKIPF